jgi:hypothetical protein
MIHASSVRVRPLVALVALLLLPLAALRLAGPADAARAPAPTVTGTVVSDAGGSVAGLTVRLRVVNRFGKPGAVVGIDTTNRRGQFAVTGGAARTRYFVELVAGEFQHGYAGGHRPRYWQGFVKDADTYLGGASLGAVRALPAFIRGRLVDPASGAGVAGVRLTLVALDGATITATSRRGGWFALEGLDQEDWSLRFKGLPVGYENGRFSCFYTVVPVDQECQVTLGKHTRSIEIERVGRVTRPVGVDAQRAPGLTGRVYDVTTDWPVKGQRVRLLHVTRTGPGKVVATTTTNEDGLFSLIGRRGHSYYVQLVAGRGYQRGYVGTAKPLYFVARAGRARPWSHRAKLGKIRAWPSTISGTVVDDDTGLPVAGAVVTAHRAVKPGALATATTRADGTFRLAGIDFERDGYLRVDGSSVGHESGYVTCVLEVTSDPEAACSTPLGHLGSPIELGPAA